MIRALVSGVLYDAPKVHTGKSGKPFTTAKVRADGKDGATVWCSVIAFNAEGERLATLPAGAALSVSGRVEVSAWSDKSGEPKAGLSLVADELATLKASRSHGTMVGSNADPRGNRPRPASTIWTNGSRESRLRPSR